MALLAVLANVAAIGLIGLVLQRFVKPRSARPATPEEALEQLRRFVEQARSAPAGKGAPRI